MTKKTYLIFALIFLFSCGSPDKTTFDNPYDNNWQENYELVTHIKFPKDFKVITDPQSQFGDFVRKRIIELNKNDCIKFYKKYKLEPVIDTTSSPFDGSNLLDSIYKQIPDKRKFLHSYGTNNSTRWAYLLDTTTCRLYCVISDPNWNGYTK